MMIKTSAETPHLRVRIEPALLARLEEARANSGRTLTGEIVSRLEATFRRDDDEQLIAATVERVLAVLDLSIREDALASRDDLLERLKIASYLKKIADEAAAPAAAGTTEATKDDRTQPAAIANLMDVLRQKASTGTKRESSHRGKKAS
jgi:hypothetical protein